MWQPQNLIDLAAIAVARYCKVKHILIAEEVLWQLETQVPSVLLYRTLYLLVRNKLLAHNVTTYVIRQHFQYYDAAKIQPTARFNDRWDRCPLCTRISYDYDRFLWTPYKLQELITDHLFMRLCAKTLRRDWTELIPIAQNAVHAWIMNRKRVNCFRNRMSSFFPNKYRHIYYDPFAKCVKYKV